MKNSASTFFAQRPRNALPDPHIQTDAKTHVLSMRGDKFDLNWRDVLGPTTTFQGCCALATNTPTPAVVRDLVEHDQPNH
jgi:hypothetical protein